MEPRVNYIIVGLFVVILTAVLVLVLIWFTATQHKPHDTYLVYMNEPATGLTIQAPVRFNGVDVGFVKDIRLNYANPQQVCLELSIKTDTPINQSTIATLMVQGITGGTFVGLSAKTANAPPLLVLAGEKYPIIPYKPSVLVQLNNVLLQVESSMRNINQTLGRVFTEKNEENISKSLANIEQVSQTMAKNTNKLDHIFKETANTLLQTQAVMNAASQSTIPSLNQSLYRLSNVMTNIEQFTNDLKNNPSILIRGKPSPLPGPGER